MEGTPPGDALPPPPQRAKPARKGARCGAGAGSPRPHGRHPHTGRGTPAAHPRGRAAGGGTAPDPRRPSQRWQATTPGDGPPTIPAARRAHRACRPRQSFIVISTLCVCCASPAACCWCRASCCFFLMRKMFFLLKYNQSRITQARDKQVEENQDQSMKGCSHKELDKENYQQYTTAISIHCNSG